MVMAVHTSKMTPEEEYQHYFTLLIHQATILDQKPRGSRRVNMHDFLPGSSDIEIIEQTPLDEDALQAFKSEPPITGSLVMCHLCLCALRNLGTTLKCSFRLVPWLHGMKKVTTNETKQDRSITAVPRKLLAIQSTVSCLAA